MCQKKRKKNKECNLDLSSFCFICKLLQQPDIFMVCRAWCVQLNLGRTQLLKKVDLSPSCRLLRSYAETKYTVCNFFHDSAEPPFKIRKNWENSTPNYLAGT